MTKEEFKDFYNKKNPTMKIKEPLKIEKIESSKVINSFDFYQKLKSEQKSQDNKK